MMTADDNDCGTKRGKRTPGNDATGSRGPDLAALTRLIVCGYSDGEICEQLGVSRATWHRWKKLPAVQALYSESGRKERLVKVLEEALVQKATGFPSCEKEYRLRTVQGEDGTPEQQMVLEKETKKTLAPDPIALIFALKNLDPQAWRDRQEVAGEQVFTIALEGIKTKADLDKLKAVLQARMRELGRCPEDTGLLAPAREVPPEGRKRP